MTIPTSPLHRLLQTVRNALNRAYPEIVQAVEEFDQLHNEAEERDENGNLTPRAHRARTKLRHPFWTEEHPRKTRDKLAKLERERAKTMFRSIASTSERFALWFETRQKLDEIEASLDGESRVRMTREDHDPESIFSLGYPFLERLAAAKVSPSSIGRLRDDMVTCIADLIKAHAKDPRLKDPNNPWVLMVNAGILEAPARHLDEDQQRVVLHAHTLRSEHQKAFINRVRRDLNLPEGMSDHFLAGAARISDLSRELTQGESSVYYQVMGLSIDRDIELLAQVLGLDSEADRERLASLVDLFRNAADWQLQDLGWTLRIMAVRSFVDGIEPHKQMHSDWVEELVERLPELARKLSDSVDSIDAFDYLIREGFALSDAKKAFDVRASEREAARDQEAFNDALIFALGQELPFKVDHPFVWIEGTEYFDATEGPVWTKDRWLEAHGLPEGLDEADTIDAWKQLEDDDGAADQGYDAQSIVSPSSPSDMLSGERAHENYIDADYELLDGANEPEGSDDAHEIDLTAGGDLHDLSDGRSSSAAPDVTSAPQSPRQLVDPGKELDKPRAQDAAGGTSRHSESSPDAPFRGPRSQTSSAPQAKRSTSLFDFDDKDFL